MISVITVASAAIAQPRAPLLIKPAETYFADNFSSPEVSARWFFNKDWSVENGVLQRAAEGTDTTRIFLKDAEFQDVIVRLDFQLNEARDIRLVTGSNGHYNAVIHIRPDHFFIQTARDNTVPWFPYHHGECAFQFDRERWYTMTVEFIGNELVAWIDPEHTAYAVHPILNQRRTYFALQCDASPARFDNVSIVSATKSSDHSDRVKHIQSLADRFPVERPPAEQFAIQKTNAHEWFYQRDAAYRALVKKVDELDEKKKRLYPEVFQTHKEFQKSISKRRKHLHDNDPEYKRLLFATHRARRAIDNYVLSKIPDSDSLPDTRRKREMERTKQQLRSDESLSKLVSASDEAQKQLERDYSELFVTNAEFSELRQSKREKVKKEPQFQDLNKQRSDAWRAQQEYILTNDPKLVRLSKLLKNKESGASP